jgi:hypothetical protein
LEAGPRDGARADTDTIIVHSLVLGSPQGYGSERDDDGGSAAAGGSWEYGYVQGRHAAPKRAAGRRWAATSRAKKLLPTAVAATLAAGACAYGIA